MLRRIGWILVAGGAAVGCDHLPVADSPRDSTACAPDEDPVLAQVVGRALADETPDTAVVEEDASSRIVSSHLLRWSVHAFGPQQPSDDKETCFVDANVVDGSLRRLVVHCDGAVLYDSEDVLGYGAEVEGAALVELPEMPDEDSGPARSAYYGYGYYAPPQPPDPHKFGYHLSVDRLEHGDVTLGLNTAEGWISLGHDGLLDQAERRWTFRGEILERAGKPVVLPEKFEPKVSRIYVSATQSVEDPALVEGARCKLSASVVSASTDSGATCRATMTCKKDSDAESTPLEDAEGPCTLTDTGAVASLTFVHDDETEQLTADFEAKTVAFSTRPGAGSVSLEQAGPTGIAECDDYAEKYLRCIDEKMPEAAREPTRRAVQTSIDAWQKAAEGPAADSLAATCKSALDTARRATAAMGCQW